MNSINRNYSLIVTNHKNSSIAPVVGVVAERDLERRARRIFRLWWLSGALVGG